MAYKAVMKEDEGPVRARSATVFETAEEAKTWCQAKLDAMTAQNAPPYNAPYPIRWVGMSGDAGWIACKITAQ